MLLLTFVLVGCAGAEPAPGATSAAQTRDDEPSATRASRELVAVDREEATIAAPVAPTAPPATPGAERPLFTVQPIEAGEGGDGLGTLVPATRPVAFDIDARRFPVRALDPVLHVGELVFRHYVYPRPGVLRYVAADAAALPEGARVYVEYEGEPASRVVVSEALDLP